jgi:hypothetical protein
VCDSGEDLTCPGDCTGGGSGSGSGSGGGGDGQTCCESADDACGQRGDGACQSGCAWGHDPDCDPQPPTDDAYCCSNPGDPCGWSGNGICDSGCAFVDADCQPTGPCNGSGSDAGCPVTHDAGVIAVPDASHPPDAFVSPDAFTLPPDAFTLPPDAFTLPPDAGVILPADAFTRPIDTADGGRSRLPASPRSR